MAETPTKPERLAPIQTGVAYPQPIFMVRVGMSRAALRQAKQAGLKIRTVGKRNWILGDDWLDFLRRDDGQAETDGP